MKEDETASAAQYIAAIPHYLEAWGDYEFKAGHYALAQPTIRPLFDTLQFQDALLKWTGSDASYYETIQNHWSENILVKRLGIPCYTTDITAFQLTQRCVITKLRFK